MSWCLKYLITIHVKVLNPHEKYWLGGACKHYWGGTSNHYEVKFYLLNYFYFTM